MQDFKQIEDFIQIVEFNIFNNYIPKVYYIPLKELSMAELYKLRDANYHVYNQERYEDDPLNGKVDEVVSTAMKIISSKKNIIEHLDKNQEWTERIVFVYTLLPQEAYRS